MPRIERVTARRLWDGAGRPTLEAEVWLRSGAVGRAVAGGARRALGGGARELRDGGAAFGGAGVSAAVTAVREDIAAALVGLDSREQGVVDRALIAADGTPDKHRLGGNALLAVSLAVARAAAARAGEPLWRHLAGDREPAHLPLPVVDALVSAGSPDGGGSAASQRLRAGPSERGIASVGIVAVGAETLAMALDWSAEVMRALGDAVARFGGHADTVRGGAFPSPLEEPAQALDMVTRAIQTAGFAAGEDVALAVDVAAGTFGSGGRYVLPGVAGALDARALVDLQLGWLARYPIAVLEDPLAPDGGAAWPALTRGAGANVVVVGGDVLACDSRRVTLAGEAGACTGLRVEPAQAGTLTEAKAALEAGRGAGWRAVLAGGSGTATDAWPAEVAAGWSCDLVHVGGLASASACATVNELIRIAARLPNGGKLRSW